MEEAVGGGGWVGTCWGRRGWRRNDEVDGCGVRGGMKEVKKTVRRQTVLEDECVEEEIEEEREGRQDRRG